MTWLILAAIAVAIWLMRRIHRHENLPTAATPPMFRCQQRTCARYSAINVTSRATGEQLRVCPGCYDQGVALGWWA